MANIDAEKCLVIGKNILLLVAASEEVVRRTIQLKKELEKPDTKYGVDQAGRNVKIEWL